MGALTGIGAAFDVLKGNWKLLLTVGLVAALGIALMLTRGALADTKAKLAGEQAAHRTTVANYRIAAAEATIMAARNIVRVKAEQDAINERTINAYETRLADSAVRFERLRDGAQAYSRSTADPALSGAREAACRAYAGTSCEELPALMLAAQQNTDQLIALQAWAGAQSGVVTNEDNR